MAVPLVLALLREASLPRLVALGASRLEVSLLLVQVAHACRGVLTGGFSEVTVLELVSPALGIGFRLLEESAGGAIMASVAALLVIGLSIGVCLQSMLEDEACGAMLSEAVRINEVVTSRLSSFRR